MQRHPPPAPEEKRDAAAKPSESDEAGTDRGAESVYEQRHSGRRAAGHGGGSLDSGEEGVDGSSAPGSVFSGAGRSHTHQESLQRETAEELESRSGPYVRSGQPADGAAQERQADGGKQPRPDSPESDDQDSGPPRTGGARRPPE